MSVNICSIVPLPCLNPTCFSGTFSSTPVLILSSRILQKIFDGIDKEDIPQTVVGTYGQIPFLRDLHNERSFSECRDLLLRHELVEECMELLDCGVLRALKRFCTDGVHSCAIPVLQL